MTTRRSKSQPRKLPTPPDWAVNPTIRLDRPIGVQVREYHADLAEWLVSRGVPQQSSWATALDLMHQIGTQPSAWYYHRLHAPE